MQSSPTPSDLIGLLASAIGDSLKRRNAWIVEKEGPVTRVRVPMLPKGVAGVIGLSILILVSAAMIVGMSFIASTAWRGTSVGPAPVNFVLAIVVTIGITLASVMALTGIWHIVLFVHIPESRKPDAIRFDNRGCEFPRLGVATSRASCRTVRVVTRLDPPGISNRSDAPRQDIRIVIEEQGVTREVIAIPHGARLDKLGQRLAEELGVPLEKVVGPPWEP